jgi:hypothetical protein
VLAGRRGAHWPNNTLPRRPCDPEVEVGILIARHVSSPASRTPTTVDSLGSAVVIQFVCANASHRSTGRSGFLVWHHGTCGYCADDGFVGPHAWIEAGNGDSRGAPPMRRAPPKTTVSVRSTEWVPGTDLPSPGGSANYKAR